MKRFELLASPDRARLTACRAWDRVFRRFAAVKRFPPELSPQGMGSRLLTAWERWLAAPHPAFLRPAVLDFELGWLVREWADGFSLRELIEKRPPLTPEETLVALREAPAGLDHAAARGLLGELSPDKIYVHFHDEESAVPDGVTQETPEKWPEWNLRMDPLRLAHHLPDSPGVSPVRRQATAAAVLAALVRELTGTAGEAPERRVRPLTPAWDALLAPGAFSSASGLFQALRGSGSVAEEAVRPHPRAPRVFTLQAAAAPARADGAETLTLRPLNEKTRVLRLVTGREFRVGRAPEVAHLVATFTGQATEGAGLTQYLGRIHTRIRWDEGRLRVLDGTEAAPSRNGTFLPAGRVPHPAGTRLRGMTVLQLGDFWRATLLPAQVSREGWGLAGVPERKPARRGPWGAVFTVPWTGSSAAVETVWLLQEAGLGLNAAGEFVWDTEALGSSPAAFGTSEGVFYLLNRRLAPENLLLEGVSLAAGEGGALHHGRRLRIGAAEWMIELS